MKGGRACAGDSAFLASHSPCNHIVLGVLGRPWIGLFTANGIWWVTELNVKKEKKLCHVFRLHSSFHPDRTSALSNSLWTHSRGHQEPAWNCLHVSDDLVNIVLLLTYIAEEEGPNVLKGTHICLFKKRKKVRIGLWVSYKTCSWITYIKRSFFFFLLSPVSPLF